MATLLRGKNRGNYVKILQWCNDWFMVEPGGIVSPTSLQLNPDEIEKVLKNQELGLNGILFGLFEFTPWGGFKRRKRKKLE